MKYFNKKVIVDGIKFDSKLESNRYIFLKDKLKRGEIKDLKLQVKFELLQPIKAENVRLSTWKTNNIRGMAYIADFSYVLSSTNKLIVEDTKGYPTPEYKVKLKFFIHMISDMDLEFHEIGTATEWLTD